MPSVSKHEERRFWKDLCKLFNGLVDAVKERGTSALTEEGPEYRRLMHSNRMSEFLNRIIGRMVRTQRKVSASSWREAAQKSTNGREMYELVTGEMKGPVGVRVAQLIAENAAFIKTLPEEWAKYVTQYAAREALKGKRPEEVEAELRKVVPEHMQRNLKCIARTECSKANAAIVQARAEMCGIRAYIWRCVKDERSRDAHKGMDGVLVFYDDPPNPEALFGGAKPYGNYHAGDTFNCRCFQEPVVDTSFLPDIVLVHDHGNIRRMTRKQIEKEFGKIA